MASDQPLKPPKNLISKVSKLSQLLLSKSCNTNFLVSQYITKTIVSLNPSSRGAPIWHFANKQTTNAWLQDIANKNN